MSAEHTPGPWHVAPVENPLADDFTIYVNESEQNGSPSDADAEIVTVHKFGHDAEANARLIAAAPELLEICRQIAEGPDTHSTKCASHWEKPGECNCGYDALLAAIAKAEGRA